MRYHGTCDRTHEYNVNDMMIVLKISKCFLCFRSFQFCTQDRPGRTSPLRNRDWQVMQFRFRLLKHLLLVASGASLLAAVQVSLRNFVSVALQNN